MLVKTRQAGVERGSSSSARVGRLEERESPRAKQRAGLHYNWHRHYDPSLGRYTQPDPLGFVDGPSVYAYAGNSPATNVDPLGLFDQGRAAGGEWLGHSDFPGSRNSGGPFDYNLQDKDPSTEPYRHPESHFRDLPEIEHEMAVPIRNCDVNRVQRLMHQGQDYFVHYAKGFRKWTGHVRPEIQGRGWHNLAPAPGVEIPLFPETLAIEPGHRFDHDDYAWTDASTWTQKWVDKWSDCGCGK
ncbi:MAG: RHS repeat-associated core domain-containing protein [Hyphomicrobium sp.]